jgi:hypothetical protein
MFSENFSQFQVLPEHCNFHQYATVEIYCSCKTKLCFTCLKDHCHEGLFFESIKEKVSKFHTEVNKTLNFINSQMSSFKRSRCKIEESSKKTCEVIKTLQKLKSKLLELLNTRYFITFDILLNFQRGNFLENAREEVLDYYRNAVKSNRHMVESRKKKGDIYINFKEKENQYEKSFSQDEIPKDATQSINKANPINITNVTNIINMNLPTEPPSKLSSISPHKPFPDSNKENVDPLEEVYVSQFNQFLYENSLKADQGAKLDISNPIPLKCQNTKHLTPLKKQKNKAKKVPHLTVKSEPIIYSFNFENLPDFLDSSFNDLSNLDNVKIICITCRDKFTVSKEQSAWKNRCDVCTENIQI